MRVAGEQLFQRKQDHPIYMHAAKNNLISLYT
jgi:hypothetical protein